MAKQKSPRIYHETECCLGGLSKNVPLIFTSERKYADVGIKLKSLFWLNNPNPNPNEPDVIVQFEVVSNNDVEATRLKLAFGLCDQLRYIMNHSNPTQDISVSGFVVPVNEGIIELAKCSWNMELFRYSVKFSSAGSEPSQLISEIRTTAKEQEQLLERARGQTNKNFSVPIVITDDMKRIFGEDVEQVKSGASIVLCSESKRMVYKTCFDGSENMLLIKYVEQKLYSNPIAKEYVCFPTKTYRIGLRYFVEFPMHMKPFSVEYARQHLRFFCTAVMIAIRKMHEAGFAHLDIRLENICYTVNSRAGRAVLIDLDRSRPVDELFEKEDGFGNSTMYQFHGAWTNRQIDWRQFGILLHSIKEKTTDTDYHKIEIPRSDPMEVLDKLFHFGEIDESLLKKWIRDNE